ncbi:MAG: agmatine deiminase family protein [Saprospiraceae bacterium]
MICLILLGSFLCCNDYDTVANTYTFPPEWAPQEAVWTDFATDIVFVPNQEAKLKIISTLSNYIPTKVVYDNDSLREFALNALKSKLADISNIHFIKTSFPMNWIRDPGPLFLSNGTDLKLLDFKWNCYGNAYDCKGDLRGSVDNELAQEMNLETDSIGIYLEGGGIEVSSNSILAYKAMALQRNPDKSLVEVTHTLIKALGKSQMIWLDEYPLIDKPYHKISNYFGFGANGHIDVTTRFLNDSTILATVISAVDRSKSTLSEEDGRILESNVDQLKNAKRPNGLPYQIVTVEAPDYSLYEYPGTMPDRLYANLPEDQKNFLPGDSIIFIPSLEYANYLITNGAILVSKYWQDGMPESERLKDEKIQTILKEYFPSRDIVPLDVTALNWGGGGIHCRTQQEPKINTFSN